MNNVFFRKMRSAFDEYKSSAEQKDLNQRLMENEKWYRLMQYEGGKDNRIPSVRTGYLFNAILTKHADAMDNYPDITILPRESEDEELANVLTGVIPYILENNNFEQIYSDNWFSKLKTSACYMVGWDPEINNGEGDIKISKTDLLHLYWQPGINDIEDSEFVFYESFVPRHEFLAVHGQEALDKSATTTDVDSYDVIKIQPKQEMVLVIDCYYKKLKKGKDAVVHFCSFSGEYVIFASEDKKGEDGRLLYEKGYYEFDGYPFVFDCLYPAEQSVAGFGVVDVLKDMQQYIDSLESSIQVNNRLIGKPRYIVSNSLGVSPEDFVDYNKEIIFSENSIEPNKVYKIQVDALPAQVINSRDSFAAQMKEIIGNRDFQQGGTSNGVTSGTALTVMQSVGDKLSRDIIKQSYRSYKKIILKIIELIRQFYSVKRTIRITGKDGGFEFIDFDNSALNRDKALVDSAMPGYPSGNETSFVPGDDLGISPDAPVGIGGFADDGNFEESVESDRVPISKPYFDVKLTVQKTNPYSREMSNQTILSLAESGLLNPQNLQYNLPVLRALQFEGKDVLLKELSEIADGIASQSQQTAQAQMMQSGNVTAGGDSSGNEMVDITELLSAQRQE